MFLLEGLEHFSCLPATSFLPRRGGEERGGYQEGAVLGALKDALMERAARRAPFPANGEMHSPPSPLLLSSSPSLHFVPGGVCECMNLATTGSHQVGLDGFVAMVGMLHLRPRALGVTPAHGAGPRAGGELGVPACRG